MTPPVFDTRGVTESPDAPPTTSSRPDQERALLSRGISDQLGHLAILRVVKSLTLPSAATLVDVGCGRGQLWYQLQPYFAHYMGVDIVRHEDFPTDQELVVHNLANPGIPIPDGSADVAIASEVTPQIENPRVLFRELARIVKPGGWVIVTNPNLLSLSSFLTLLLRQRFNKFQDEAYPMMLTPVMEVDLLRMAAENGLVEARIFYVSSGRIPLTNRLFPTPLWKRMPRLLSDNLGVVARKPS